MAAPNKNIAMGSQYNQLAFMDSDGRLTGSTTTAPSTGATGSPAYHIKGWKTGAPTIPDPDEVVISGDDVRLGSFLLDSIANRQFTVDVAIRDLTLFSRMLGVNVQTWGEIKSMPNDIVDADVINCCLIIQGKSKKYDSGNVGQAAWGGVIVPLATARPLGRVAYTERDGAVYRFAVSPQTANRYPWGISIAEATAGSSGAGLEEFQSDNPIALHTWRGDASTTAFTVQHVPISVAKAYAAERIVGGGVTVKTISSVNTSTKQFTVSGAPALNAELSMLYELSSFVEA